MAPGSPPAPSPGRRWRIRGVVQGVGFRPFVVHAARTLGLAGTVENRADGVRVEAWGPAHALDDLGAALARGPAPARVESLEAEPLPPRAGPPDFRIVAAVEDGPPRLRLPPDRGPCPACAAELVDPTGRRAGYPFTGCTACGPRLTVLRAQPWARDRTALDRFPPCPACAAERADPADRRFGSEIDTCPACGPTLTWQEAASVPPPPLCGPAALAAARAALARGAIVALQAVGGFQLACDAADRAAVARLRDRKRRPSKPLALLAADLATVRIHAAPTPAEAAALEAPSRPIVLLARLPDPPPAGPHAPPLRECESFPPSHRGARRAPPARSEEGAGRTACDRRATSRAALRRPPNAGGQGSHSLSPAIAPGRAELGFMLPASPLHLLLAEPGRPLVLTSGNLADEPIARTPAEATARLAAVADAFLFHDREILVRADDSLTRLEAGVPRVLRRSRGLVPDPVPVPCPVDLVAAGGDLKGALAVLARGEVQVGPHLGDLTHPLTREAWRESLATMLALTGARPAAAACDAHPDYASTRLAEDLGLPLVRVQHHHAHLVAALAEHGLAGPALGLVFDGAGWGDDGTVWGGEFLRGDAAGADRLAHLVPVRLPGGDAAARQPWRMALAWALAAGLPPAAARVPPAHAGRVPALVEAMQAGVGSPWTSSVGRLFDAVAALLGLVPEADHEGQAAAALEAEAAGVPESDTLAGPETDALELARLPPPGAPPHADAPRLLDPRPMIVALVRLRDRGVPVPLLAAAFHAALARAAAAMASSLAERARLRRVVLTGGCFQNARLARLTVRELSERGLDVIRPSRFPANDGGLALGQAAVAAARLAAPPGPGAAGGAGASDPAFPRGA